MTNPHDETCLLNTVKNAYSSVAKAGSTAEYASTVAQSFGYTVEQLEAIPMESHMGLGCGNPTVTATLKPGETVLDLGSGGGIDVFLAAAKIGVEGKAIGLDMSADMIQKARNNATRRGLFPPHVAFVECSLTETLPIKSSSIDCVLSNCVINLLPPSGKTHIFREMYRVLKPGGRLFLDDILAKQELPADIRNDMKQYVACISGAVQVHEYKALLESAGFHDSLFVDSRADLNIYIMAAKLGSDISSCCGAASNVSAGCGAEAVTATAPSTETDLNRWAASYQIYAKKPGDEDEIFCEAPLERWWDAFPAVRATNVARIFPTDLAAMLRSGGRVAVIDVRGDDHSGGHVKGSHNVPAQKFHINLAALHAQFAEAEAVVFYCGGSVGRGPRCAGWYQDFLDTNALVSPSVRILDGGIRAWMREYSEDLDLTEGYPRG
ncbi:S-adenosyl-L-methionine-dependent methyltransferase [Mycena vulgaris]|nr:S-adenosyl-L-methionine-dependent methyltransferase [Mycena vulgaris]